MSGDERGEGWDQAIGDLLGLVVHDLRNPVATISANVSFVREVGGNDDPDAQEALEDVEIALGDLMRGLEQLGWVGRWIRDASASEATPGELESVLEAAVRRVEKPVSISIEDGPIQLQRSGVSLTRLLEILLRNALERAPAETVRIEARREGARVRVEIIDTGKAVGEDLREHLFTVQGQQQIKSRADGRYSRVVGLLAARALADAVGASLEADGEDGAAVFRVWLS